MAPRAWATSGLGFGSWATLWVLKGRGTWEKAEALWLTGVPVRERCWGLSTLVCGQCPPKGCHNGKFCHILNPDFPNCPVHGLPTGVGKVGLQPGPSPQSYGPPCLSTQTRQGISRSFRGAPKDNQATRGLQASPVLCPGPREEGREPFPCQRSTGLTPSSRCADAPRGTGTSSWWKNTTRVPSSTQGARVRADGASTLRPTKTRAKEGTQVLPRAQPRSQPPALRNRVPVTPSRRSDLGVSGLRQSGP